MEISYEQFMEMCEPRTFDFADLSDVMRIYTDREFRGMIWEVKL